MMVMRRSTAAVTALDGAASEHCIVQCVKGAACTSHRGHSAWSWR
jgi:hypothetical protein